MRPVISAKLSRWLLPAVLILFILEVLLLPFVVELTYAGRSEGPTHVLTYTTNSLMWDTNTGIDEHGVAQLDLFDVVYDNTVDGNGDFVVAPGTEGHNIIRLKNDCPRSVTYTAVLYIIRTNTQLPVTTMLEGEGLLDTEDYQLPYQITEDAVVRAVSGELPSGQIQDFDISWLWQFDGHETQDMIDTILGNMEDSEQITVGIYITVDDEGNHYEPSPGTGDNSHVAMYLTLMGISLCVLLLLLFDRRKREAAEK